MIPRLPLRKAAAMARGTSASASFTLALISSTRAVISFSRAWALAPDLLLLDEPTANLDPAAQKLVEEVLQKMIAAGTRILMASHDLSQARRLASHVIFMYRGRIKEQAPADRFFDKPENDLAQAFLQGELLWWRRRAVFDPDPDVVKDDV